MHTYSWGPITLCFPVAPFLLSRTLQTTCHKVFYCGRNGRSIGHLWLPYNLKRAQAKTDIKKNMWMVAGQVLALVQYGPHAVSTWFMHRWYACTDVRWFDRVIFVLHSLQVFTWASGSSPVKMAVCGEYAVRWTVLSLLWGSVPGHAWSVGWCMFSRSGTA